VPLPILSDVAAHPWQLQAINVDTTQERIELLTASLVVGNRTFWIECDLGLSLVAAFPARVRMKSRPDTTRGAAFLDAERMAEQLLATQQLPAAGPSPADRAQMYLPPSQRARMPEAGTQPGEFWDERFFLPPSDEDKAEHQRRIKTYAFSDEFAPIFLETSGTWRIDGVPPTSPDRRLHLTALRLGVPATFLERWTRDVIEACTANPSRRLGIRVVGRNTQGPPEVRRLPHIKDLNDLDLDLIDDGWQDLKHAGD
jgi:hypothetical protein